MAQREVLHSYFQMTKPTIVLMVVVTTLGGLALAADQALALPLIFATLLGTWLSASSASVFNHVIDRDIDQAMIRTMSRPVASGQVSKISAVLFGTILGVASFLILWIWANPLAAMIALAGNLFYVLVYTWYLKPRTVQNIVIGGAAGSVGPLIGWAAVTGEIGLPALLLFLLIFLWTPPHFWALALRYKDDYARAKVPMMPVVRGDISTRRQIFLYTLTLLPIFPALYFLGSSSLFASSLCLGATLYFAFLAWRLWHEQDNRSAMSLFHYSCLYILIVFLFLAADRLVLFL